jgi:hypothetical protein
VSTVLLLAAKSLVVMFFLGIVGSLIVVVVTFVEDLELLYRDEKLTEESR